MARIACTHFVPAAVSRRHHHPFFTSSAAFLTSTTTQSLRFFHSKKCISHHHGDGVLILGIRNFSSGSRISMSLKAGIVGLPNVGKSTLFNAVVENGKAHAANFPFRTIEPNVKVVGVPDPRLQVLANISKSQKTVPASIEVVDIAGLIKGASQGEPEDALMGYIFGMGRATDVAHCVWKRVIRKGDIVVDATCGNGYDTLAMLKMVQDEDAGGFVYGMDIQEDAVKRTLSLLDSALDPTYRQHIKIFTTCHSRIAEVLPENRSVRLVAFNLGYLPGGDKRIITSSHTTLLALEAAKEILASGGLISLVVYVGHPGGREEFETVHSFASKLPVDDWFCSQIQLPNRPESPVLMFLFKR